MKFSIITCTYNSKDYLQRNIDSVKNQTFQDFEHIFIDGNSTDGTVDIINMYKNEYPDKVKLYQFKPKGISNAMNQGIRLASGEYLNHLHSDDCLYDTTILEKIAKFITERNNPDWIYGKALFKNMENGNSMIIPHRSIYRSTYHYLMLLINYVPHQSVFLRKQIFEKYGYFDETFRNFMDYEYWLRLTKAGIKGIFFNDIVCIFSIRNDSQSTIGKYNDEYLKIFERYLHNKIIISFLALVYRINRGRTSVFTMNKD